MTTAIVIVLAVLLDIRFGEARQYHPLVGFGRLARRIESALIAAPQAELRVRGAMAVFVAVVPWVLLAWLLSLWPRVDMFIGVLLLYLAIGGTSLVQHGRAVAAALSVGDLALARERVGWIVSRDCRALDEAGVSRAAVESVLENGNDALFAALFWFVLLGTPGVVLYRLVNTLDAMWGYRTERYQNFGWTAAKLDDLLNWIPARLTAATYALVGDSRLAWRCWRTQGQRTDSPNAGVVMASGAGALGLQLGGPTVYHGVVQKKPILGEGLAPGGQDIERSIRLVQWALMCWLGVMGIGGVIFG